MSSTVEKNPSSFPVGRAILAAVGVGLGGLAAAAAHAPTRNAIGRQLSRAKAEIEATWARARDAIRALVAPTPVTETEKEEAPREHGLRGAESRAAASEHARRPHTFAPTSPGVRDVVLRRVHRHA